MNRPARIACLDPCGAPLIWLPALISLQKRRLAVERVNAWKKARAQQQQGRQRSSCWCSQREQDECMPDASGTGASFKSDAQALDTSTEDQEPASPLPQRYRWWEFWRPSPPTVRA